MKLSSIVGFFSAVAATAVMITAGNARAAGLSPMDSKFVKTAAQGGDFEIILGRYAASHAVDPGVQAFGSQMVTDHSKGNKGLERIAMKDGFRLPTTTSLGQKLDEARLKLYRGSSFDKAYISEMVKGHIAMEKLFRQEIATGQNPDVKVFAARTLPTVEHHLGMAKADLAALESGTKVGGM